MNLEQIEILVRDHALQLIQTRKIMDGFQRALEVYKDLLAEHEVRISLLEELE